MRILWHAWNKCSRRKWPEKQGHDSEQGHPQDRKASRRVQSRKQLQEEPYRHCQECTLQDSIEESCHCKVDVRHFFPPCSLSAIIFLIRFNSVRPMVSFCRRFMTSSSHDPPKKRFTKESSAFRLA